MGGKPASLYANTCTNVPAESAVIDDYSVHVVEVGMISVLKNLI